MDKRQQLLEAALRLFVENGFHGTATAKIAKEAGVSNGTLFNFFKTKDELILQLYMSLKDELAVYIEKNTAIGADIKQSIKTQISASLFWGLDNKIKFQFIQQFQNSTYLKQVEQEIIDKQLLPHLLLLEKGIENGIIKPLPAEFLYSLISGHTFGAYHYLQSKDFSNLEQHDIVQKTFELVEEIIFKK